MENRRVIKVGYIFRVLAGIVCLGVVSTFFLDPGSAVDIWIKDGFNLAGLMVVFPLFLYVAIFGRVPNYLVENVDDETFSDFINTENIFKKFSPKSIGFAVVALTMFAYIIYKNQ